MKKEKKELTQEEKMVNKFKLYTEFFTIVESIFLVAVIVTIVFAIYQTFINNFNMNALVESLAQFLEYDGFKPKLYYIFQLCIQFGSGIILVDCLRRMTQDTYKQKTPFIKQNITRINIIAVCSLFCLESITCFLIIIAIKELFKYGFKLQTESDETL